ncbi:MAG: CotH kinase family protein [Lachnospiraceae bacterium]|nr:CotH kinase family protein [Lachnospiraceae bacterium]
MKTIKRTMRLICLMILTCAVTVSACACGSGENITTETGNEAEPTLSPKDTWTEIDVGKGSGNTVVVSENDDISQYVDQEEGTKRPTPAPEKTEPQPQVKGDVVVSFYDDGTYAFSNTNAFYNDTLTVSFEAPAGAKVYYTLDCTEPTESSSLYSEVLKLEPVEGNLPDAYVLRAKALLPSGEWTGTVAKTFFVAENVKERYTTLVFSITGEPSDLTEKPDGIFYGRNYKERGRESEREVYIEALGPDGYPEIGQFGGVRIYGGYSRQYSIKSMKLFARKSYDPDHGTFKINDFGTKALDGSEKTINKYDKLVLRDAGNDFQFCFLRDELSQTLCKKAGFDIYEAVVPAAAYLNGKYYGLFWLHENYCDEYFKQKFGKDAPGEFVVLEGSDQNKKDDDDEFTQKYVNEYNEAYNKFINMDLTNDANYKALNEFMDVNGFLDFFAWNISLNNWDWPNNNYKVMRYVPAEGDTYSEGVFDGRYRFLPHDMDYSYGLYGQDTTQPYYDTLRVVMNSRDNRYSPLFTKLMEREDCKEYFKNKTIEFFEGALSKDSIIESYNMLHESRSTELDYYYDHIDQLRKKGDFSLWCNPGSYYDSEAQLIAFAENRKEYALKYIERDLYGGE